MNPLKIWVNPVEQAHRVRRDDEIAHQRAVAIRKVTTAKVRVTVRIDPTDRKTEDQLPESPRS